jgi:DNA invertase Pin-like site-specific DNA recombinase
MRCAIYTRKSVEDDYHKEVTSLEAQRVNCEKYIELQAGKGWCVSKVYEDYGKTGANIDRKGFQALLADVRADKIDVVVVYKLDRLTRSQRDFVSVIEGEFCKHNVSFVSATESFDTSTPTGQMILNMLLVFAEFERKQTSMRVKDKNRVAKKNGIWTGGNIPIGYKTVDRKLVPSPVFVPLVQFMFQRFLEVKSVTIIANEINAKISTEFSEDDAKQASIFHRQRMYKLLKCPLYKGYVRYENELYKGRHEAIVDEATWDKAQEILAQKPIKARAEKRPFECAFVGRIRCKECNKAMIVTHSTKKNRKYPYYTCLRKNKGIPCVGLNQNIDAELVQRLVVAELRQVLKEPEMLGTLWKQLSNEASPEDAYKKLENIDKAWEFLAPGEQCKVLQDFVHTVWLSKQGITIEFAAADDETSHVVSIDGSFYNRKNQSQVFVKREEPDELKDPVILKALVFAEIWQAKLDNGELRTHEEIAQAYGFDKEYVQRGLFLAQLSPQIKSAIIRGKLHPQWRLQDFKRKRPSPDWRRQESTFLADL